MVIRDAVIDDARAMATVRVRSWRAAYRGIMPDEVLDELSIEENAGKWRHAIEERPDRSVLVVAVSGREVVGFCSGGPARTRPDVGEIYALYVHPDRWRGGNGSALLAAATQRLRGEGFLQSVLWVLASNENGRRFYETQGWELDGGEASPELSGHPLLHLRYRRRL